MWATRRANRTIATSTPTPTPIARLSVARVPATVLSITIVSLNGIRRSVRTLCQSKVVAATSTITATSAAIGMVPTTSPSPTTRISRNAPDRNVDNRVRAPPVLTLMMVCPISAHPPMPPNSPVTMFATPWPHDSRVLSECVSVTESTSLALINDSSSPTTAIASANGAMIFRVSAVSGTSGSPIRSAVRRAVPPWSPTVGTATPVRTVNAVRPTITSSGAGTAVVSFGIHTSSARPAARSAYTAHGTFVRYGNW